MFCTLQPSPATKIPRQATRVFLCGLWLLATFAMASAQTFTTLASFNNTNGASPNFVFLVQGLDGYLYGTAQNGGTNSSGTVFRIFPTGNTILPIYHFCSQSSCADGGTPWGGLVLSPGGSFYGATGGGGTTGSGTVFKVTPTGTLTSLHSFDNSDGSEPTVGLILASNGNFYGTTTGGGASSVGNIYEVTPAGGFTSLGSPPGYYPDGRLVQGANGLFYGTAYEDGIFQMTAAGKFTTLHTFSGGTDGDLPHGPLIQGKDGNFYGGDTSGSSGANGIIFKMTPSGKLTTLYTFCSLASCADGGAPQQGVIQATDGNLYGITTVGGANHDGTIFQLTPAGALTTLYSFPGGTVSYGGLLQATDGNFYGVTKTGGSGTVGSVFRLSTGLKPFVHPVTTSGKVGATVVILGTNLTGATAVDFNGTAATVVKLTKTYVSATVPAGATSGSITVTTPGGVLTSDAKFRVTPQVTGFSPSSGPVGTPVTITGVSLTGATRVTFGGVAASFTVNSDTQITATVPTGALTGKIAVTTAGGAAASAASFTVN